MHSIKQILDEHKLIKGHLSFFDEHINSGVNHLVLAKKFDEFKSLWNIHEEREDTLFRELGNKKVVEKMDFEHRQLRGFSKVIEEALLSRDREKIKLAFENDGRMLINHIKRHIIREESILSKL